MRRNEVHDDAPGRALDAPGNFEQAKSYRARRRAIVCDARQAQAQLLEDYEGGGGEQDAELIGQEARALVRSMTRTCLSSLIRISESPRSR